MSVKKRRALVKWVGLAVIVALGALLLPYWWGMALAVTLGLTGNWIANRIVPDEDEA